MTAVVLKLIAMLTMLCDHCNYIFNQPPFGWYVGRLAFPLYAMMLVDSYRHLREHPERMKKYVLTLAVLAVVSEFAYDFAFAGVLVFWGGQNQILQFLVFVLAAMLEEKLPSRAARIPLWIGVLLLSQYCLLGYYALGIVALLALRWYLDRFERWGLGGRFLGAAAVMALYWVCCVAQEASMAPYYFFYQGAVNWPAVWDGLRRYAVTLLLIPVIALYSGQYGNPPKWFRAVYRYFYPAHLCLLALISALLRA